MTELTPKQLRNAIRSGEFKGHTSGYAQGFVQCNLAILPGEWAAEFLLFCQLNPKPCPVVGVSANAGDFMLPSLGDDIDVRKDIPAYRIFVDGQLSEETNDITQYWRDDFTAFLLGCSFSFEEALLADGLEVRNITENVNVPMFNTNIACQPAGRFSGNMVVSMRPMMPKDAIRAIQICTRFPAVHGAPVHFGNPEQIGINDIYSPDYGDAVTIREGEVPVFWACGVTPQVAMSNAKPPISISHSPGSMLVTDIPNSRLAAL